MTTRNAPIFNVVHVAHVAHVEPDLGLRPSHYLPYQRTEANVVDESPVHDDSEPDLGLRPSHYYSPYQHTEANCVHEFDEPDLSLKTPTCDYRYSSEPVYRNGLAK